MRGIPVKNEGAYDTRWENTSTGVIWAKRMTRRGFVWLVVRHSPDNFKPFLRNK